MTTGKIVPITQLSNWEDNPRRIDRGDLERLKGQIRKLGAYKPLLATPDGIVLGGNMRLLALGELGVADVWVSIIDIKSEGKGWIAEVNGKPIIGEQDSSTVWLSKEQAMLEFALSDNDRAGSYDDQKLAEQLSSFPIEMALFKVDLGQLTPVEEVLERFGPEPDENEAPSVDSESPAVSKPGEVYQLGAHRLLCGDATNPDHVATLMDGKKAQMVFTDPPYNVDYQGGMGGDGKKSSRKKIANDNMSDGDFYQFLKDVMANLLTFTEGAFYVCMSSSELHNLWRAFTESGGHWQTYIIWAKQAFTLSRSDHQHQFEPIMYGLSESDARAAETDRENYDGVPIMYGWNKHRWFGGRKQGDVWFYDRPTRSEDHPTQKPVALCARAIRNSSRRGEIVLDLFGGSGSTLIACEETGRACYMMELDAAYCDVIRKRWATLTGAEDWVSATPKVGAVK